MLGRDWQWGRVAAIGVGALTMAFLFHQSIEPSMAQTPFGGPRPTGNEQHLGGIFGWLLQKQSEFYRQISATIRLAKSDGSAIWTLLAISFAYGVFHAAGPGHGKAVISSYLVANEETARRGIALSFVSALLQSCVAVLLVGVGALLLNATAGAMCNAERVIEIASYALIAAFGANLVWSKGAGFIREFRSLRIAPNPRLAMATAGHEPHRSIDHDHRHVHDDSHNHAVTVLIQPSPPHQHPNAAAHSHEQEIHEHQGHRGHVHDDHCGHSHGPVPSDLAGVGGWKRGLSAIFAVGLRPCSGAILVLVFALAQGLFWAGVAATFIMGLGTAITVSAIAILAVSAKGLALRLSGREGSGAVMLRGLELAAASLVLLFGVGLLLGQIATERVTCF